VQSKISLKKKKKKKKNFIFQHNTKHAHSKIFSLHQGPRDLFNIYDFHLCGWPCHFQCLKKLCKFALLAAGAQIILFFFAHLVHAGQCGHASLAQVFFYYYLFIYFYFTGIHDRNILHKLISFVVPFPFPPFFFFFFFLVMLYIIQTSHEYLTILM
jgi:hypothetical protein